VFRAAPGEANDVAMEDVGLRVKSVVDRGARLVVGAGCEQAVPVLCTGSFNGVVHLGDRDDRGSTRSQIGAGRVYGDAGNDRVHSDGETAYAYGGAGSDDVRVTAHVGYGSGGSGDDRVEGNAGIFNDLRGEAGDDLVTQGSLATCARLDGGAGDDRLIGRASSCTGVDPSQHGGPGDDLLTITAAATGPGDGWTFDGGPGEDFMVGSGAPDGFSAGSGWDFVYALDGAADTVACGSGLDFVKVDALDTVARDCELVVQR
jgi:hypothetical protein